MKTKEKNERIPNELVKVKMKKHHKNTHKEIYQKKEKITEKIYYVLHMY